MTDNVSLPFSISVSYEGITSKTWKERIIQGVENCWHLGGRKAYVIDTKPVDGKILVDLAEDKVPVIKVALKVALCIVFALPLLIARGLIKMTHNFQVLKPPEDLESATTNKAYFEKALAIRKKIFGEEHPNVAEGLVYLGLAQAISGEL